MGYNAPRTFRLPPSFSYGTMGTSPRRTSAEQPETSLIVTDVVRVEGLVDENPDGKGTRHAADLAAVDTFAPSGGH